MKKYDTYNNELTNYIEFILGPRMIKDMVGDITGDILDVDVPINYVEGDQTIEVATPLGHMTIKITKFLSKTVLIFSREIGGSIYEEYTIELDQMPRDFLVHGCILEEREKGVILTNIIRNYDYCNHDDADKRLVDSIETRSVFDEQKLDTAMSGFCLQGGTIKDKFENLKNLKDLAHVKKVYPLLNTTIDLRIPNYISNNYRRNQFPNNHKITVNNESPILLYEFLEGNKTLERARDLLYGNITSRSINDLKTMIDYTMGVDSKAYIYGFNRLADIQTSTNRENYSKQLSQLENDLIGSSLVTMPKEYYEYIRELILATFHVAIDENITPDNVVQLIKKDYRRDNNEEKK